MDFTTFKYDVIENSYVVVAVIKNMQLVAEIRFFPSPEGDEVIQREYSFVHCSDEELMDEIVDKANELAREYKLIKQLLTYVKTSI